MTEEDEWKAQAACKDADIHVFFPTVGGTMTGANAYCNICPVIDECLEFGLHENFGIWGGTSERERRKIRRQRHLPHTSISPQPDRLIKYRERTEKIRAAEVRDVVGIKAWLEDHRKTS